MRDLRDSLLRPNNIISMHEAISRVLSAVTHCSLQINLYFPFCKGGEGGGGSPAHSHILEKKSFIISMVICHAACSVRNALLYTQKSILSYGKKINVITTKYHSSFLAFVSGALNSLIFFMDFQC